MPSSKLRVTKPLAPWLTPKFQLIMKDPHEALLKFQRNQTEETRTYFKEMRNFTNAATRREEASCMLF